MNKRVTTVITGTFLICSFLFTSGFSFVTLGKTALTTNNDEQVVQTVKLPFNDIEGNDAEAAIMEMYARGIMKGYDNGSFRPKQPVTKLETIVMLDKLLGYEPSKEDADNNIYLHQNFSIPQWAVGYVALALKNNLLLYSEVPTLAAQELLIRQDAAVLAVRALKLTKQAKKKGSSNYIDTSDLNKEVQGAITVAEEQNIIKGYSNDYFQPKGPVTRGEIAAILSGISENLPINRPNEIKGFINEVNLNGGYIKLTNLAENEVNFALPDNYICFLNGSISSVDKLAAGDYLSIIAKQGGLAVVMAKSVIPDDGIHLSFDQIDIAQAPAGIQQWVEENKNAENYLAKSYDGFLYILVSRGEKMTSGYSVDIRKISRVMDDNYLNYNVEVELTDPAQDVLVNQVISYPYSLVKLEMPSEPLNSIKFVDETNKIMAEIINKK